MNLRSGTIVLMLSMLSLASTGNTQVSPGPVVDKPVEVMIVGMYHMSNPGHDLHDAKSDDVLQPKRQVEIERLAERINQFHPTKVGVEWDASVVKDRYPKYLAGTLPPSTNEVVQLGFRLAKKANAEVYGLDADGDFPWQRLKDYAEAYGFKQIIDNPSSSDDTARLQHLIDTEGVVAALQFLNQPDRIQRDNAFYRKLLRVGSGTDQPGADLVAAWQHRNLLICANLLQVTKPGDRVVVFFGAGHAFLLRQCVEETPGLKFVDPQPFLTR